MVGGRQSSKEMRGHGPNRRGEGGQGGERASPQASGDRAPGLRRECNGDADGLGPDLGELSKERAQPLGGSRIGRGRNGQNREPTGSCPSGSGRGFGHAKADPPVLTPRLQFLGQPKNGTGSGNRRAEPRYTAGKYEYRRGSSPRVGWSRDPLRGRPRTGKREGEEAQRHVSSLRWSPVRR